MVPKFINCWYLAAAKDSLEHFEIRRFNAHDLYFPCRDVHPVKGLITSK